MQSVHHFHIPVMGLAFTIDSPVKVARYGIASTVSIIEDKLIELMRLHYYKSIHEKYIPITPKEPDYRAKRITDYLDLMNRMVHDQFQKLKASTFETGSEITKYLEMLPTKSELHQLYQRMLQAEGNIKISLQEKLRSLITPGAIDVNIMTKVDKDNIPEDGVEPLANSSDALAALRGYANSTLSNSSVILSAGMNPRLFGYLEQLDCFDADAEGNFKKKLVIKVSDFRSALIQGKMLAKKGLWVSEFRIESGLNCGGHAFASDGSLMGPILDEFTTKRESLIQDLFTLYKPAAEAKTGLSFTAPHPVQITVQGGIGTAEEAAFLINEYNITSTGWGTPFLLCPEATTVDKDTLQRLQEAKEEDVILSKSSPLGVRFNYLKGTSGEAERLERIAEGKPGSPCTEKHLVSNTEFTTEPICTASHKYQHKKINELQTLNLTKQEYDKRYQDIISKECLCVGLSNAAVVTYGLPSILKKSAVTICPGPNIAYFNRVVSLKEMTDHIYGRANVLPTEHRPHMFIKELELNVNYLKELTENTDNKAQKDAIKYANNLLQGITYYTRLAHRIVANESNRARFISALQEKTEEIQHILERIQSPVGA